MEILAGFLIALAIGATGLGAGTLTAPVLMLFFGLPAAASVATALVFSAAVKLLAAPVYFWRGGVNGRVLAWMCLGGLPGVLAGSLVLRHLDRTALTGPMLALVGLTVVVSASINLFRPRSHEHSEGPAREHLLPWLFAPIGLEVGFSSAGAGALGTIALFHATRLAPAQVVGTDLVFGLLVSAVGSGVHWSMGNVPTELLTRLLAGGLPGVLLGAHLAHYLPARKLRMGLCVWLVYLGSSLLLRGVRLMPAW